MGDDAPAELLSAFESEDIQLPTNPKKGKGQSVALQPRGHNSTWKQKVYNRQYFLSFQHQILCLIHLPLAYRIAKPDY